MRFFSVFIFLCFFNPGFSQSLNEKLFSAIQKLETDSQFKHATLSLYVVDKNGAIVFDKNSQTGLATASCLKVVMSVTAFELLGKDFTYKTFLGYDGKIDSG